MWRKFGREQGQTRRASALAAVLASALAFASGLAVAPTTTPDSLSRPTQATAVKVSATDFKDSRTVQVAVEQSGPRSLIAGLGGTVTSSACTEGGLLRSGTAAFAIDGEPLLSLATTTPLWRDLHPGDSGADVRSLQAELNQLGHGIGTTATVTSETLEAYAALAASLGSRTNGAVIERSRIVWLPDREQPVQKCTASVGSVVGQGQGLAELPPQATGARITNLPQRAAPGERRIAIDSSDFPMPADGRISDPGALGKLIRTPSFLASQTSDRPGIFAARYELAHSVRVLGVPPGAIFGLNATAGCISSRKEVHRVVILGSQLGVTFVSGVGVDALSEIDLKPEPGVLCE
ncbi:hypothetical protein HNP00_004026 [Arthrobacter sp. AZCC_0090]|nr:hypothetical protein [Arthrobacter sp. AZCC_0090]